MPFIIIDEEGNGQSIDVDKVAESFKLLMEQFDADPQTEISLTTACPEELLTKLIGAGYGPALTTRLAEATAKILTYYPPLPTGAVSQLDDWMTQLGVRRNMKSVEEQAKSIVAAALSGDQKKLDDVRDDILKDPIEASAIMQAVFLMGLTLIAVAKGELGTGASLT